MPLSKVRKPTKAHCRKNISRNIKLLRDEGRPQAQAVAIALSVASKAGCKTGRKGKAKSKRTTKAPRARIRSTPSAEGRAMALATKRSKRDEELVWLAYDDDRRAQSKLAEEIGYPGRRVEVSYVEPSARYALVRIFGGSSAPIDARLDF